MRILSLTLLSLLSSLIALSAAEKPNIIFFLVDDYDKPETSPYGGKALTPNLDRLAAEGDERREEGKEGEREDSHGVMFWSTATRRSSVASS